MSRLIDEDDRRAMEQHRSARETNSQADERAFKIHRRAAIGQQTHPGGRILAGRIDENFRLDEICQMRAQPSVQDITLSAIRELIKTVYPNATDDKPVSQMIRDLVADHLELRSRLGGRERIGSERPLSPYQDV